MNVYEDKGHSIIHYMKGLLIIWNLTCVWIVVHGESRKLIEGENILTFVNFHTTRSDVKRD